MRLSPLSKKNSSISAASAKQKSEAGALAAITKGGHLYNLEERGGHLDIRLFDHMQPAPNKIEQPRRRLLSERATTSCSQEKEVVEFRIYRASIFSRRPTK